MENNSNISAREALSRLQDGHKRFIEGRCQHPHCDAEHRKSVCAQGQRPFATIIGCSDSRAPVEVLFDQGVGDLFVVRVPGNVCNGDEIAAAEYGVAHLETPLCVVLGHTRCGAVTGVVNGAILDGHLAGLVRSIRVAAEKARQDDASLSGDDLIEATVRHNVLQGMSNLTRESPALAARVNSGATKIVGAVYDLATGDIRWFF